jgi:hypothetical protein
MLAAVLSGVDLALRHVLMARSSDLYCRVGCCSDSARVGKRAQRAPYADIALIEIGHAGLYRLRHLPECAENTLRYGKPRVASENRMATFQPAIARSHFL